MPSPPTLTDIIRDLDRLNSWVRSPSYEPTWGGPKKAIYFLKLQAIKRAARVEGLTTHRKIAVGANCRRCDKGGNYIDSWGETRGKCWTCSGTHLVMLRFIETQFADGPKWHTPADQFLFEIPVEGDYQLEIEWKPNTPGRDMTPTEVAECLNRVEAFIPERQSATYRYTREGECRDAPFEYQLFIGRVGETTCSLCGGATDDSEAWHHVTRGRLHWLDRPCQSCRAIHKHGVSIFDAFPVPTHLLTPPICEWMVTHPVVKHSDATY